MGLSAMANQNSNQLAPSLLESLDPVARRSRGRCFQLRSGEVVQTEMPSPSKSVCS